MLDGVSLECDPSRYGVFRRISDILEWYFLLRASVATDEEALASVFRAVREEKFHGAMSHHFSNMVLVVGRVALPLDPKVFRLFWH